MKFALGCGRFALCLTLSLITLIAAAQDAPEKQELVVRDLYRLQLAGAQAVIDKAMAKAHEMQLQVNIAVVDAGGHPLAFARMDGARAGSVYTAQYKAASAALMRGDTGPLPAGGEPNMHLSLAVEHAATAGGGKATTLKGGVLLVIEGQVVGAVGVGGASGEQDQEIARAGAAVLQARAKE